MVDEKKKRKARCEIKELLKSPLQKSEIQYNEKLISITFLIITSNIKCSFNFSFLFQYYKIVIPNYLSILTLNTRCNIKVGSKYNV